MIHLNQRNLAANPGDRIDNSKSIAEKAEQLAVDSADMAGEPLKIPTFFIVEGENGNKKALHHIRDAEEISDTIRQARMDKSGDRQWW